MTRITDKELSKILQAGHCTVDQPVELGRKRSRFNAVLTTVDDHVFKSAGEAARYMVLKRYLDMGLIADLELQPVFVLQEPFVLDGKKILAITYKADFRYTYLGVSWVEDWKRKSRDGKPFLTAEFKRTYKLFRAAHPDVLFWINCEVSALPNHV